MEGLRSAAGAVASALVVLVSGASLAAGTAGFKGLDDAAIVDPSRASDWLAYGKHHNEQRFSLLAQVNLETIGELKPAWYLDLPADVGLVSTPLAINGVLYFVGDKNLVRAVNGATGELLWEHDPKLAEHMSQERQTGWVHNRGITAYGDKIFQATWDGRLIALDAATGKPIWSTRTFEKDSGLYITGAPKAFKGKVLIGNGGSEVVARRAYVSAYVVETGELAWRFHIVPGNPEEGFESEAMEMAAETWTGEWWKFGGGGNAWHGFTYDDELDQLYIGTGNGGPWNRKVRSPGGGDNLFLCSIVALDPDTGEYLWHYQTVPGDTWDYNSNMDIMLADLVLDEQPVKAILHAPKNGFFYVIDRTSGKVLSAEPFAETTWASHIDLETGRPVEIPDARYVDGPARIAPSIAGAHSWTPMSFSPQTGLVYLPTIHAAGVFDDTGVDPESWQSPDRRGGVATSWVPENDGADFRGSLQAWDPIAQQAVWEVKQPGVFNGGTLATAGNLVFQGRDDGVFVAYDARSGEIAWEYQLQLGISASPITYAIGDKQYIALLVGAGGGAASGIMGSKVPNYGWKYGTHTRRLVSFALDGEASIPPQPAAVFVVPLVSEEFVVDSDLAETGMYEYETVCANCHGPGAVAAGMAPDLRASPLVLSAEAFASVVRDGARQFRSMPKYSTLSDADLLALRHYIRQRAESAGP